jgi:indole-3-glycerol phosphate synthase
MSGTRLDPIVDAVRRRNAERRETTPLAHLARRVEADPRRRERFVKALTKPELAFICEMKRRSPSAGWLFPERDASQHGSRWHALADAYRAGGASALSVLTEEDHFAGTLDDLRSVEFTRLPRLRKDFVLDEAMVLESCLFGADAVLLIAAILDDATLARLRTLCREYGVAVLIEAHDESELERALAQEPELIGVNARDLTTLQTDLATVERLLPRVPKGPIRVAESGIKTIDDLKRVRAAGADCVLVGETLVKSTDPATTLKGWREALNA